MKITTVTYGRSVPQRLDRGTWNTCYSWFAWTAEVEAGEDPKAALAELRALADKVEFEKPPR